MDTSVNIAMPAITAAFQLGQRDIQWVVTCYMLAYGSLMLTCGKLGDLYGHRRILRTGLAICAVAFAICALATAYPMLLAGRMLQGVGIALAVSCAPALATALYPESGRTLGARRLRRHLRARHGARPVRRQSGWSRTWGWSGVFAFRMPLVLLALALSWLLPAGIAVRRGGAARGAPLRLARRGLLIVWIGALDAGVRRPARPRNPLAGASGMAALGARPRAGGLAALGVAAFAAFLWHEARCAEPIIRPSLFRSSRFAVLNGANLLINLANFSILLIVPYFLINAARLPIDHAGLVLAMSGAGMMVGSWVTGRIAGRVPPARLAFAGIVMTGLGLSDRAQWPPDAPPWVLAGTLLFQGFGVGLFQVAYNDSVIATLPVHDRGVAGSLTMMVRTLGIIGGATGLSALLKWRLDTAATSGLSGDGAFLLAFQETLTIAGVVIAGSPGPHPGTPAGVAMTHRISLLESISAYRLATNPHRPKVGTHAQRQDGHARRRGRSARTQTRRRLARGDGAQGHHHDGPDARTA